MGVYMQSKNMEIPMGYGALFRLRGVIAKLTNKEISEHYAFMQNNIYSLLRTGFAEYDAKTEELYKKYKKEYGKVIDFLYAPDSGAKMTYGCAKQLLNTIGDYNDDEVYGKGSFKEFRHLLMDAAETKSGFWWE